MKIISKKKYKILKVVFLVICSFFICQNVNALEYNPINYIEQINKDIINTNNIIKNEKTSVEYSNNEKYKALVDYLEKQINVDIINFNNKLSIINNLTLKDIIDKSNNNELKNNFLIHGSNISIDINNISDIFYKDEPTTILITKSDINNIIINEYLIKFYNIFNNYKNNFNASIFSNENLYDNIFEKITIEIDKSNQIFNDINNFENKELSLGNNPNLFIGQENIYTLLNKNISRLYELKKDIDLSKIDLIETELNTINKTVLQYKAIFDKNNSSYKENGIQESIKETEKKYDKLNKNLINNKFNLEKINNYKQIINLEEDYRNLNKCINTYLQRKSSDALVLNNMLKKLKDIHLTINKDNVLSILKKQIINNPLNNIDTINLYLNLLDIKELDNYLKQIIIDAKNNYKSPNTKAKLSPLTNENNKEQEIKQLIELPALEEENSIDDKVSISKMEEAISWGNIFKISLIVFFGALIIYFLNKEEELEAK